MVLDQAGWDELTKLLLDTLNRAIEIQEEAANRLAKEKTDPISSTLAILNFETATAGSK
jgi:hypothetical protein